MCRARLATYPPVQLKQVRLLTKGHVCVYMHKFHIFHSSNNSLGFNELIMDALFTKPTECR